jgi:hypothetical protein
MPENTPPAYSASKDLLLPCSGGGLFRFLFWSLLFGLAYTQPRLYYSNQNQYFLHGLAQGGLGFLKDDWLANTADPTPLFSTVVALTYRYLHESFFYLYYILIIGIYFHSLLGIFEHLSGGRATARTRLAFIAFFVLVHSAVLRWTSAQLFGVDYPWYFQAGVANQYILGAGLQPSVFGVLLVLSVCTFLQDRPFLAVTWLSLAAVLHSTYLLSAASLKLCSWVCGRCCWFRRCCFTFFARSALPRRRRSPRRSNFWPISASRIMPRWTAGWTASPGDKLAGF